MTDSDRQPPFAGRTVLIVHPAWHSCGTYQVVLGQAQAWRALGAHVVALALRDWPPGSLDPASARWRDYIAHTGDMPAHERFFANAPVTAFADPRFWSEIYWPLIHGDHARATSAMMAAAPTPEGLSGRRIDLVHCNHFFCMPVALRFGAPVMVETHDIQARQYDLRNDSLFIVPPRATYDAMLDAETGWLAKADLVVHLNDEEKRVFARLAPERPHALLYPAVPPVPTGPGGADIVIVASGNLPNTLSVIWYLEHVAPRAPAPVRIVGNVEAAVKARAPALHARYASLFAGRVDDIAAVYANAGLVLLPTTEGHGLSIKTVEAMASGAPLVATRAAFRGMTLDPAGLSNVALADTAEDFAAAISQAVAHGLGRDAASRAASDTRRAWDEYFSARAYMRALSALATPLIAP